MNILANINQVLILPSVLFLAVLVSQCSLNLPSTFAMGEADYRFDESGHGSYHSGPGNPSPGHDGYNQYQRQEEQIERYRQDSLNLERLRERNADASAGSLAPRSAGPTYITPPGGGRQITCYPTFHKQVICN